MTEHAVVIAGAGPAGMMLAAELALAKVDVAVLERRPDHVLAGSRAGGLNSRTIEVLDQRGVADRFLAEGQVHEAMPFGTTMLDTSDFPTRHPYFLGIWQNQIERIMAAWLAELRGADLLRKRGDGLRAGRLRRRRRAVRRPAAASAVPRRMRRRTQRHPQGSRHRVPRMGSDEEQPDRRGAADRGAAEAAPVTTPRASTASTGWRMGGRSGSSRPSSRSGRAASQGCAISARRSSPCTAPTSGSTVRRGSRGSPT